MKAHYVKLTKHLHDTVYIRKDVTRNFYQKWHYHDQIELVYILKGHGTRFIGDNISTFSDGDLLLVGDHLPHLWKAEMSSPVKKGSKSMSSAIVIQFPGDFGADGLMGISEMTSIKKLIDDSKRGLFFNIPEDHTAKKQIKKMLNLGSFDRMLSMLSLLKELSETNEKELLSSIPFADHYRKHNSKRMNEIYAYILNNFSREIKLKDLATVANMTSSSLCRFFKHSTQKSISNFINEVRIGYACKLLIDDKLSISDVCFNCGYNNLSYFNRQFKKIIGISPSVYQMQISRNLEK